MKTGYVFSLIFFFSLYLLVKHRYWNIFIAFFSYTNELVIVVVSSRKPLLIFGRLIPFVLSTYNSFSPRIHLNITGKFKSKDILLSA